MASFRLPEELEKRLDAIAARTARSKSYYVREALLQYLEDVEDALDAEIVLSQPGRHYTTQEALEHLGLTDVEPARILDGMLVVLVVKVGHRGKVCD